MVSRNGRVQDEGLSAPTSLRSQFDGLNWDWLAAFAERFERAVTFQEQSP